MAFLLNSALVEPEGVACPLDSSQLMKISFEDVIALAQAEFCQNPNFPEQSDALAAKVAALVSSKSAANAMRLLVVDPALGPGGVSVKLAQLSIEVMADLLRVKNLDALTPAYANAVVWSVLL